jgi:chromosome segregation ATPase
VNNALEKRVALELEALNRYRHDLVRWLAEDEERIAQLQMRVPRLKRALETFEREIADLKTKEAAFFEHATQAAERPQV